MRRLVPIVIAAALTVLAMTTAASAQDYACYYPYRWDDVPPPNYDDNPAPFKLPVCVEYPPGWVPWWDRPRIRPVYYGRRVYQRERVRRFLYSDRRYRYYIDLERVRR